jgi:transposase
MCPGNHESAGKHTSGKSRPGDPWLKGALGLAATAAARSKDTYLAARYKRIEIRRGKKRALVAVGHTILTSVWHMLTSDAEYADLGGDCFLQRTGRTRQTRRLVSQLNMLGFQVTLQSADAV